VTVMSAIECDRARLSLSLSLSLFVGGSLRIVLNHRLLCESPRAATSLTFADRERVFELRFGDTAAGLLLSILHPSALKERSSSHLHERDLPRRRRVTNIQA